MTKVVPVPTTSSDLIADLADWLMSQALLKSELNDTFVGCCERLHAAGVPLWRSHVAFRTLHPLFGGMGLTWTRGTGLVLQGYEHHPEGESKPWRESPQYHMIERRIPYMRRRLTGPDALLDFPILEDLQKEGGTDFFAFLIPFTDDMQDGIIGSWSTDRASGFSDSDIQALMRVQRRLGVAFKVMIKDQIAQNVLTAYLGPLAGEQVMSGQIHRGEGESIKAVIWYSDLRRSTDMADALPRSEFLQLLNSYFECSAGAVLAAGGEVLSFIGDAVLAIFPIGTDAATACRTALAAARDATERMAKLNRARASAGEPALSYGLGLHVGNVTYGNIGVPERLEFTAIGSAINEVVRLEGLTKSLAHPVLVSGMFADNLPDQDWSDLGDHQLRGIDAPIRVLAPAF